LLMTYNSACLSGWPSGYRVRAAAPAPAREILRMHTQSDDIDSVTGPEMPIPETLDSNLAEMRRRLQEGTYEVNLEETSTKLVNEHVTWDDTHQR